MKSAAGACLQQMEVRAHALFNSLVALVLMHPLEE